MNELNNNFEQNNQNNPNNPNYMTPNNMGNNMPQKSKSHVKDIIYIIIITLLLACIAFLVLDRNKNNELNNNGGIENNQNKGSDVPPMKVKVTSDDYKSVEFLEKHNYIRRITDNSGYAYTFDKDKRVILNENSEFSWACDESCLKKIEKVPNPKLLVAEEQNGDDLGLYEVYILTDNGDLYYSEYADDSDAIKIGSIMTDFKKLDISNVSALYERYGPLANPSNDIDFCVATNNNIFVLDHGKIDKNSKIHEYDILEIETGEENVVGFDTIMYFDEDHLAYLNYEDMQYKRNLKYNEKDLVIKDALYVIKKENNIFKKSVYILTEADVLLKTSLEFDKFEKISDKAMKEISIENDKLVFVYADGTTYVETAQGEYDDITDSTLSRLDTYKKRK